MNFARLTPRSLHTVIAQRKIQMCSKAITVEAELLRSKMQFPIRRKRGLKVNTESQCVKKQLFLGLKSSFQHSVLLHPLHFLGTDTSDTLITSLYPKPTSQTGPKTNCSFKAIISPSQWFLPPNKSDTCDVTSRPMWLLQATPAACLMSEQLAYLRVQEHCSMDFSLPLHLRFVTLNLGQSSAPNRLSLVMPKIEQFPLSQVLVLKDDVHVTCP